MRNKLTFHCPEEFTPISDEEGILSVDGARWFVEMLQKIPDIQIDPDLCQEDWGVVIFAKRNQKRFWFGIGFFGEQEWIAYVHHSDFAWIQKWSRSGKVEYNKLIEDLHRLLASYPQVTALKWYREKDRNLVDPAKSPDIE